MHRFAATFTPPGVRAAIVLATLTVSASADAPTRPLKSQPGPKSAAQLASAIRLAESSLKSLADVKNYKATFVSSEIVRGRRFSQAAVVKFRDVPFSVYMRFTGANTGREVLYVAGRNGGKLLARDGGLKSLVGTIALSPTSTRAMSESSRPITDFGMKNMVQGVIGFWKKLPAGDVTVRYYADAKLTGGNAAMPGVACRVLETIYNPASRADYAHTRLYLDKKSNLPVRVERLGRPQPDGRRPLVGQFTYWNVKTNVGLTERDFDPRNPEYGFR